MTDARIIACADVLKKAMGPFYDHDYGEDVKELAHAVIEEWLKQEATAGMTREVTGFLMCHPNQFHSMAQAIYQRMSEKASEEIKT